MFEDAVSDMDPKNIFEYYINNNKKILGTVIKKGVTFHVNKENHDFTRDVMNDEKNKDPINASKISMIKPENEAVYSTLNLMESTLKDQLGSLQMDYDKNKTQLNNLIGKHNELKNRTESQTTSTSRATGGKIQGEINPLT